MSFNLTNKQKEVYANDLKNKHSFSDAQIESFWAVCESHQLDPLRKQIYAMPQGNNLIPVVGIDGFRAIAERTGQYGGQTKVEWCDASGKWVDVWLAQGQKPAAARVGIIRKGFKDPLYGIALWSECASNNRSWNNMGPTMLAKCAEANGMRKAFPNEASGLYIEEEFPDEVQALNAEPPSGSSTADKVKNLLKGQGLEIVSGSEVKQPSDVATFTHEEVEQWLMPLIAEAEAELDDLRAAMRRSKSMDKDIIAQDPLNWHVDWKDRIEAWAEKMIERNAKLAQEAKEPASD